MSVWCRNSRPSVAGIWSLVIGSDRERQGAVAEHGHEVVHVDGREAAADLAGAVVIGSLMNGADTTLPSRTIAKKWLMFSLEQSANRLLPGSRRVNETARSPDVLSTAGLAVSIWSPLNRAGSGTGRGWPSIDAGRPAAGRRSRAVDIRRQRHEVEPAGRPDELLDRLGVLDARQLDDDAVGTDGVDKRLGDTGRVHAALDDVADRVHRVGVGDAVAHLLGLVLDPESALQVEPELPLETARIHGAGRGSDDRHAHGDEIEEEGEHAEDDDEQGDRSTHRGGLYRSRREAAVAAPGRGQGAADAAGPEALVGVRAAEQEEPRPTSDSTR